MVQIRWKQRLQNFDKALKQLVLAVQLSKERPLTELENIGLLKTFEFTFELSWNVLKDYLTEQGISEIIGSKGAFREAYKNGLIQNGETWMEMIQDRNLISHNYDENVSKEISERIKNYTELFKQLSETASRW